MIRCRGEAFAKFGVNALKYWCSYFAQTSYRLLIGALNQPASVASPCVNSEKIEEETIRSPVAVALPGDSKAAAGRCYFVGTKFQYYSPQKPPNLPCHNDVFRNCILFFRNNVPDDLRGVFAMEDVLRVFHHV